jgi:hypothetical protein
MSSRPDPLLREAERELSNMRSSRYQHTTRVDEEAGDYRYDCSGFIDYALERVAPEAFAALPHRPGKRPLAQDFVQLFEDLGAGGKPKRWRAVASPAALRPGAVLAWRKPHDIDSHNTGHVMIVAGRPRPSTSMDNELLVPVIDSTQSAHADDSRSAGETGLGSGTIGLVLDDSGAAVGYRWRGGRSRRILYTAVAFARLSKQRAAARPATTATATPLRAPRRRAVRPPPAP